MCPGQDTAPLSLNHPPQAPLGQDSSLPRRESTAGDRRRKDSW